MALISLWFYTAVTNRAAATAGMLKLSAPPTAKKLGRGVGDLGAGHAGAHADFSLFFEHAS
jgi:hypothetical protein